MVQIYVHMVFFLHMTSKAEGGWTWMSLIFTLVLAGHHLERFAVDHVPPEDQHDAAHARAGPQTALRHQRHGYSRFRNASSVTPAPSRRIRRRSRRATSPSAWSSGARPSTSTTSSMASPRCWCFPAIFFPFESPLDATLLSFAVFALAFIARPIGTVVFMEIQRRWGRYTKLTLALVPARAHPRPGSPSCPGTAPWARSRSPCSRSSGSARALRSAVPGTACRRCSRSDRAARQARLVRDDGAVGRADRLHDRQRALPVAVCDACRAKISWTGAGAIPSSAPSRSTWWPCSHAFGWWSRTNTTSFSPSGSSSHPRYGELLRSRRAST